MAIVVLKPYKEWLQDYSDAVDELHGMLDAGEQPLGEAAEKRFIRLLGLILRLRNILAAFDEFQSADLLGAREVQDYQSVYNYLYEKYRKGAKAKLESIVDDLEFEMELAKQVEVGINYILMLAAKYHESNCEDKQIRADIARAIDSSPTLRDKRELIERVIEGVNVTGASHEAWAEFVARERDRELRRIMDEERLDQLKTLGIMARAWSEGYVRETGTAIVDILPKGLGGSMFSPRPSGMAATLERVIERLKSFFNTFHEFTSAPE